MGRIPLLLSFQFFHTTWYDSHTTVDSPKCFTLDPSVVLVTSATRTSHSVCLDVKSTLIGKKLPPSYESPMTPGAEGRRGTDAGGTHEGVGPQARRPRHPGVPEVRFRTIGHAEREPGVQVVHEDHFFPP